MWVVKESHGWLRLIKHGIGQGWLRVVTKPNKWRNSPTHVCQPQSNNAMEAKVNNFLFIPRTNLENWQNKINPGIPVPAKLSWSPAEHCSLDMSAQNP